MSGEWFDDVLREIAGTRPSREESRVLVVEDDAPLRTWLITQLSEQQMTVKGAATVAEALSTLAAFDPRVVVVDKNLPDGSGLELIRRGLSVTHDTEFIVVTGDASLETAIEAINLGAFGYIPKPFPSADDVTRRVRAALERRRVVELNHRLARKLRSAEDELERTRLEIEMMGEVIVESRRQARSELRRVVEELLEPLSVVEADVGSFTEFAAAAAGGQEVGSRARAELGRLKMLEQLVRRLYVQTEDAAGKLVDARPGRTRGQTDPRQKQ